MCYHGPVFSVAEPERNFLFAGGVIGGFRNGKRGGLGGERGGGRLNSSERTMKRASRAPPKGPFRRLNSDEGAIHGKIPMTMSIPFWTALPKRLSAAGFGEVSAGCFEPVALGVRCIPGRGCDRHRDRFPGLSRRCRCFGSRVRACRFRIRHRRLEFRRGSLAMEVR